MKTELDFTKLDDSQRLLSKPWQKFFLKFFEIEEIKVSKWKEVHLLAYICKRYKEHFGFPYSVTIQGAPSKSPDIYMMKRIIASLGTTNMRTVREYVDWVFDEKVIKTKRKLRKFGYFSTAGFVNEFKIYKAEKDKPKRSTPLPEDYRMVADNFEISVKTYGDLAFIKLAADRFGGDKTNPNVVFFSNLRAVGFDESILERLEE